MTLTSKAVAREVRQILEALMDFGIASFINPVAEDHQRVTWHASTKESEFLLTRDDLTIRGYMHWLENGQYSAVLMDGSLLQISYDFAGGQAIGHRLAFIPCPVNVLGDDSQELLSEGWAWEEVVRSKLANVEEVHMKSAVRFDYDPVNASQEHPAAHLTLNTTSCRIACLSPMRLGRFLDFIFHTFYPQLYADNVYLQGFAKDGWFSDQIDESHKRTPHLSWAS